MNDGAVRTDDLPSISVRRPILAIVMNLLIVLAGMAALRGVEVRELPNVENPIVTIRADFPGAAPGIMDAEVTRVLEGAAARVPGVREISSASEEDNARVRIYFEPSTDINNAANDVREAVAGVRRTLPEGVEDVVVIKADDEASPIIRLSVSTATLSRERLTRVLEDQVATALFGVPGVADVQVYGDRSRSLKIVVDPLRLAAYGLSIDDVAAALKTASLDVPAGSFDSAQQDLIVRADASVVKEAAVERIMVGSRARIRDVAEVFYAPEKPTSYVRLDGRNVMGLGIVRQAQSNTLEISAGVDKVIERLNHRLKDLHIVKTSDDAIFISGAVHEVLFTLLLGIAIVVLVILLFFGSLRLTLIPAVTIPVSLIGTLAAIWLLGFSVNILTLLALVLATGLVVDDAIVVLENVERTHRSGVGPLAAAVLGTRQVFFAVMATTITLASVFIPIALLPGRAGQLFTEFGYVLAISVGISAFVAVSLVPMMASRVTKTEEGAPPGRARASLVYAGAAVLRFYSWSLAQAMRAPLLVVGVGILLAAAVGVLYLTLDRELVPPEDRGTLVISIRGPDGVNLEYSDRQAQKVEALVAPLVKSGEATGVLSFIGRYDLNRAYVVVPLAPWGERRSQAEIVKSLEPALNAIPGARVTLRNPNSLSIRTGGSDLEFALTGSDYFEIARAGDALLAEIERKLPGIASADMSYSTTQPQLSVEVDRERVADLGVPIGGIASTLQAMVDGLRVTDINVGDESVPVMIESKVGAVNDTDDLRNLYVATRAGRVIPLSSFIRIRESAVAGQLDRERQRRAIEIDANFAGGQTLNDAIVQIEALAGRILPPGIGLAFLGQAEALQQAERDLLITFAMALLVVLLVLAAQFESFASAFVVMVTVPFGLAAAIFALWAAGSSLNVYSQIGLVMLVGLIAKNGILIVEFANQLRDAGHSIREAAHEAAIVRFRAVTMTMLSTTVAAIPLIVTSGPGAEARQSIGWVVFGGVGIAIVAVLYITPIVYMFLAPLSRSRGDFGRTLENELREAHPLLPPPSGGESRG